MNWFARILGKRSSTSSHTTPELLNSALDIGLDWERSLSPIQGRLKAMCPELNDVQLDALNETCLSTIRFSHELALRLSTAVQPAALEEKFDLAFGEHYPWANLENRQRIFRHSIYYATKTVRCSAAQRNLQQPTLTDTQGPTTANHGT